MALKLSLALLAMLFGWMQFGAEAPRPERATFDPLLPQPEAATPPTEEVEVIVSASDLPVVPASVSPEPTPQAKPEKAAPVAQIVQAGFTAPAAAAPASEPAPQVQKSTRSLPDAADALDADLTPPDPRAVVTGSVVNLRNGPSTRFSVIGKLREGDRVILLAEKGGWAKLRTLADGEARSRVGYMSARFLEELEG
ncbi:SH3 domain-containing protein [Dinoroseobacter sp. S375]|uniref:SH3 domain-containing protein n=1 Tax=Dinoroseobacter sp. S375 TaxID=3415136 RepID=UPI003C7A6174